jgi:hypothetical protein
MEKEKEREEIRREKMCVRERGGEINKMRESVCELKRKGERECVCEREEGEREKNQRGRESASWTERERERGEREREGEICKTWLKYKSRYFQRFHPQKNIVPSKFYFGRFL